MFRFTRSVAIAGLLAVFSYQAAFAGEARADPRVVAGGAAPAARLDSPEGQTGKATPGQPAPKRANGKRSKGLIVAGLAAIGAGVALMVVNPDTSEYLASSNGNLYRKSYHVRIAGGVIAGAGGVMLWHGLKRR